MSGKILVVGDTGRQWSLTVRLDKTLYFVTLKGLVRNTMAKDCGIENILREGLPTFSGGLKVDVDVWLRITALLAREGYLNV